MASLQAKDRVRVVALGGGSAAEVLGLALWVQELRAAHGRAPSLHIDVMDAWKAWEPTVAWAERAAAALLPAGTLSVRFHCVDLLSPGWADTADCSAALRSADLVTMGAGRGDGRTAGGGGRACNRSPTVRSPPLPVYAASELYDRDRAAAAATVQSALGAVREGAWLVVADPRARSLARRVPLRLLHRRPGRRVPSTVPEQGALDCGRDGGHGADAARLHAPPRPSSAWDRVVSRGP